MAFLYTRGSVAFCSSCHPIVMQLIKIELNNILITEYHYNFIANLFYSQIEFILTSIYYHVNPLILIIVLNIFDYCGIYYF